MKKSWSHKLFLRINTEVGKDVRRDAAMTFFAESLIIILCGLSSAWLLFDVFPSKGAGIFLSLISMLAGACVLAIAFNWLFGIVFRFNRPIREFPSITQLITPMQTWKSFPSDHTTLSWTIAWFPLMLGDWVWGSLMVLCACLVSMSRVYVGVHYPRDIIGGFFVAILFVSLSPLIGITLIEPGFTGVIAFLFA